MSARKTVKLKTKAEFIPWYRRSGYRGSFTEADKRELDAIREQPKHPAADWGDLPDEVQSYINELEMEFRDAKEGKIIGRTFLLTVFFVVLAIASFVGWSAPAPTVWTIGPGVVVIVGMVVAAYFEMKKLSAADEQPYEGAIPTDEALRENWEIAFIVNKHMREREEERQRQAADDDARFNAGITP